MRATHRCKTAQRVEDVQELIVKSRELRHTGSIHKQKAGGKKNPDMHTQLHKHKNTAC